jgi:hypothetical protein
MRDPIGFAVPVIRREHRQALGAEAGQPRAAFAVLHVHQFLRQEGAALNLLNGEAARGATPEIKPRPLIGANAAVGRVHPGSGVNAVATIHTVTDVESGLCDGRDPATFRHPFRSEQITRRAYGHGYACLGRKILIDHDLADGLSWRELADKHWQFLFPFQGGRDTLIDYARMLHDAKIGPFGRAAP